MYCAAYNLDSGLFLHYGGNGNIHATKTKSEIKKDIENMYNKTHSRGYEASMSACIHFMATRPIVVKIPNKPEKLMKILEPGATGGVEVFSLNSLTTPGLKGLKVKPEFAEKMIAESGQPDLINGDFNRIMIEKETKDQELKRNGRS